MLEAQRPAAAVAGHAKDGKWLDVAQPEGRGRRLKHMRDRSPDDGRVADGDDVTAEARLAVHPAGDALSQLSKTLAAVRCCFRLGHPDNEVFRLFRLDRRDRLASPAAMVAVAKRRLYRGPKPQRLGCLAGAQGGARDNTVGAGQGGHPARFFCGLAFQRFVEREQGLAARSRRAVADPGEARVHGRADLRIAVGVALRRS